MARSLAGKPRRRAQPRYNPRMSEPRPSATARSNALLVVVAFLALGAGLIYAAWRAGQKPEIPALLWPDPPVVGEFRLDAAGGGDFGPEALEGHWTLMFFGFMHCPDVCPTTLSVLKQVTALLHDTEPFASRGQVVFISLDPERDTPEALREYVQHFNPDYKAATATEAALNQLTGPIGVIHTRVALPDGDYSIDHTGSIFLIDPERRVLGLFSLPHVATEIAAGVRAIMEFERHHR